ncbi:MAG: Glutathione hydrolase proenzyme [Phycisphaerae bacterium]|nr:Glutathione hydrolase proenzyme [Phycisphaerae bacterium]
MRRAGQVAAASVLVACVAGCAGRAGPITAARGISPRDWPADVLARYRLQNRTYHAGDPEATSRHIMIGGTTGPIAIHAGLEVLRAGGSAADAALTTSLAQIVLSGGSWNSFAGILYLVYYDARSGEVHALNAGYNTVLDDKDPLSIPGAENASGRTALVPGFMAGAEAAHRRFGRLPWASLFEPAIFLAREGFEVDAVLGLMIEQKRKVLRRLPEGRAIFVRPDQRVLQPGDLFVQPALADTLEQVAQHGAAYFYTGPWAARMVELVRREGGRITGDDLRRYEPTWSAPLRAEYRGHQVCTIGFPEVGGIQLVEALNLLEAAELHARPRYYESADSMLWYIRATRLGYALTYSPRYLPADNRPDAVGITADERVTKAAAARNWERLQSPDWMSAVIAGFSEANGHSDGVVAVDEAGNIAALVHSSNALIWGSTGIFVDGVSIPDSASFQQQMISRVPPGSRLPNITNPCIVLKDGKPALAASGIGSALHECMLQNLVNCLDYGMSPRQALDTPKFGGPVFGRGDVAAEFLKQSFRREEFPESFLKRLEELGQPAAEASTSEQPGTVYYWLGIQRTPAGWSGAVSSELNGIIEGD